jgi:hypothetical protein
MVSKPKEEKVCWIASKTDVKVPTSRSKIGKEMEKMEMRRPSEQADMPFHKGWSTVTRCYVRIRKQNVTKIYPVVFSSQGRGRGGRVVEWE